MTIIAVTAEEFMTPRSRGTLSHLEEGIERVPLKKKNVPPAVMPPSTLPASGQPRLNSLIKTSLYHQNLNNRPDPSQDESLPIIAIPNLHFPKQQVMVANNTGSGNQKILKNDHSNIAPRLLSPKSRNFISIDPFSVDPPGFTEVLDLAKKEKENQRQRDKEMEAQMRQQRLQGIDSNSSGPVKGSNRTMKHRNTLDADGMCLDLYCSGTKCYTLDTLINPALAGGSREELTVNKHTEGVIVEPHSSIVLVNFDEFPGRGIYVDKSKLGLGSAPESKIDQKNQNGRKSNGELGDDDDDDEEDKSGKELLLNKIDLEKVHKVVNKTVKTGAYDINNREYYRNSPANSPRGIGSAGKSKTLLNHPEIQNVNESYSNTDKLNPYPALSKIQPFEVYFKRNSLDEPWGFSIRQVSWSDEINGAVWQNYMVPGRPKRSNLFIIDKTGEEIAAARAASTGSGSGSSGGGQLNTNSELFQWNSYHARMFRDFHHNVHRGDRVLKINKISAFADPKAILEEFNNSLGITMVIEKRDITREVDVRKVEVRVPETKNKIILGATLKNIDSSFDKLLNFPPGATLKNIDSRFLSFDKFSEQSLMSEYRKKDPHLVCPNDKILGLNGIPGEAHTEILRVLQNPGTHSFDFLIGRPIKLSSNSGSSGGLYSMGMNPLSGEMDLEKEEDQNKFVGEGEAFKI